MKTIGTILIAAIFAAFLTFTSSDIFFQSTPNTTNPIIVHDDPGGMVVQEIMWVRRLAVAKVPVKIDGECISACTLLLSLGDKVCVTDNALLGFHAAINLQDHQLLRDESIRIAEGFYPKPIRDWFQANIIANVDKYIASKKDINDFDNQPIFLNADQLTKMGIKHC